jgi:hypothetical protein
LNFPWIGSSRTALDGAIDHPNRVARRPCRTDSCLLPARRSPSLRKVPTSICLDTNVTRSIWFALLRLCSEGPDRCRLSVFCQRQRRLRRRRGRLSFSITQASVIARLCRIKLLHQDASKKKCDRVVKIQAIASSTCGSELVSRRALQLAHEQSGTSLTSWCCFEVNLFLFSVDL